jgi:molecular chaperone HtpG
VVSSFQVDLGGIVDLLGRHLYSTPRVYLRELVQNAVDALTARNGDGGSVTVTPCDVADDGRLHVADTGIGLSRTDIDQVLSTIGGSSKRDELGLVRDEFLGHFGIGLLSCFLVTDEVELITCATATTETLRWSGRSDGTFTVEEVDPVERREDAGTEVRLAPRPGQGELLSTGAVTQMLRSYATHLPHSIGLQTADGVVDIADHRFCWDDARLTGAARRTAAVDLCVSELGFSPLDVIALSDPGSGTQGYAYIPPTPIGRSSHRVYSHAMLVTENEPKLLPEWACFVRAVINTDHLKLTASREAFQDDEELATVRDQLGEQVRNWLLRTARTNPERMTELLRVHQLGMRAMAVHEPSMLDLVARFLPFESTRGVLSLDELLAENSTLHYCDNDGDFRQITQIAAAQDLTVIDASHAYDVEILQALQEERTGVTVASLDPQDLIGFLAEPSAVDRELFAPLVDAAEQSLARTEVRTELRNFEPATVDVLLLASRRNAIHAVEDELAGQAGGVWAEVMSSLDRELPSGPRFVVNTASPQMRRLASCGDAELTTLAVQALYAHALASGRHRLTPYDATVLHRALPALLKRILDNQELS